MAIVYSISDNVEPVAGDTIAQIASIANYAVIAGCGATYNAGNMEVVIAAGSIIHNGSTVTVAGDTVTLVSDPTHPRWAWIAADSGGAIDLVSGTASATPSVPALGDRVALQLVKIQAAQTIADNCSEKLDKRVFAPSTVALGGLTQKYKSAVQTFTTNATYADVTASSGTLSFDAVASGVYIADYYVPVSFGGTGGVKFQITGPASPTNVDITGDRTRGDAGAVGSLAIQSPFTAVTAFSSDIAAFNSNTCGASASTYPNDQPALVHIRLRLRNGANAGTVTLQAAQNSSNSTTTLGLGSTMTAKRII